MAYKRTSTVAVATENVTLAARLVGLGFGVAGEGRADADIERTLVEVSRVGMLEDDLRLLSLLTTWLGVHHARVHADRLIRFVSVEPEDRVRAYWAAVGGWLVADRRLHRLAGLAPVERVDLLRVGTAFQLQRRGEDVLTPSELLQRHAGYRNRVLLGSNFRAEVWTTLEREPTLPVAEVARRAACSFAAAWEAARDFRLLHGTPP
jgi:hypothetical protein